MSRKGAELSTETKELIITLSESVQNKAELSRMLNIPRTTITSVLSKYRRTGTVETLTRSGRKRSFTNRDRNALKRLVKSNRRLTLQDITAKLNECKTKTFSQKTVQRELHSEGYKRRLAKKKMVVREVNRKKRVKWCKQRRSRTVDNYWKKVIFSDESQIVLGTNNRVYIWRKDDEKYNPHLVCSRSERKISLMIWGCICYDGVGSLTAVEGNINSAKYIDILDKNLWPVVVWYFEGKEYLFMDDNAPVHRAHTVENYKDQNEVTSMEWPAQSPDLNIIENIWLYMKRELQKSAVAIATKNDLLREIQSVWRNIELDYIRNLYQSIPDRLDNVIKMKGHLTKY